MRQTWGTKMPTWGTKHGVPYENSERDVIPNRPGTPFRTRIPNEMHFRTEREIFRTERGIFRKRHLSSENAPYLPKTGLIFREFGSDFWFGFFSPYEILIRIF